MRDPCPPSLFRPCQPARMTLRDRMSRSSLPDDARAAAVPAAPGRARAARLIGMGLACAGLAWLVGAGFGMGAGSFGEARAAGVDPEDLLPVDEAFVLGAEAKDARTIELRWRIAEGYYLYRHRTSAEPADAGVRAGALRLPKGKAYTDEFFGATETYRGRLVATLPDIVGAGERVSLKVRYQGCADVGVCYPPQTRTLQVRMPAGAGGAAGGSGVAPASAGPSAGPSAAPSGAGQPGASLLGGAPRGGPLGGTPFGGNRGAPLPEEQAFGFEAIADGGDRLLLRFTPARGYYLYRDRSSFRLKADGIAIGKPQWPAGKPYRDAHFGDVIVYFDPVDVPLPLVRRTAAAQTVELEASFQGCQDEGICYPPMTRRVRVALPAGAAGAVATKAVPADADDGASETERVAAAAEMAATAASAPDESGTAATAGPAAAGGAAGDADAGRAGDMPGEAASTATRPGSDGAPSDTATPTADTGGDPAGDRRIDSLWAALLAALLGGVILNLMPCVLPVLSIKVMGVIASNESPQRMRAHALWYTAGVLASFLALGALALALREAGLALGWGFQMQQPVVVAALGLIVFAFGLSLSGLWYVGGAWTGVGHGLATRSGPVGDFFTGALAVVVAAPCTAPFMVGALGWAFTASTASALLVFAMLGLGLALPFLLIGFVPALARLLPRPGAWMDTLKQLLAFPMYLAAIWLLWVLAKLRGADAAGWLAIAALLVALSAWAWRQARMQGGRWGMPMAVLALAGALACLWPIHRLARPAPAATPAAASTTAAGEVGTVVPYSAQRLADLRAAGRVVLVNMTADWCISCKTNERAVFARDGFQASLRAADAVYMVGDWTDVDPEITAYLKRYGAFGVPLYVVYPRGGGEGTVLPTLLTPGLVDEALAEAARGAAGTGG